MIRKIQISSPSRDPATLKQELEALQASPDEYSLQYEKDASRYRAPDANTLVALVGVAGTALGALVTGLLRIATQKHEGYLEISGKDWSVKVPADITKEELDRLIEEARFQSAQKIEILG